MSHRVLPYLKQDYPDFQCVPSLGTLDTRDQGSAIPGQNLDSSALIRALVLLLWQSCPDPGAVLPILSLIVAAGLAAAWFVARRRARQHLPRPSGPNPNSSGLATVGETPVRRPQTPQSAQPAVGVTPAGPVGPLNQPIVQLPQALRPYNCGIAAPIKGIAHPALAGRDPARARKPIRRPRTPRTPPALRATPAL